MNFKILQTGSFFYYADNDWLKINSSQAFNFQYKNTITLHGQTTIEKSRIILKRKSIAAEKKKEFKSTCSRMQEQGFGDNII